MFAILLQVCFLQLTVSQDNICLSGQIRCSKEGELKCCEVGKACWGGECVEMSDGDSQCDSGKTACTWFDGEIECCDAGKVCAGGGCADAGEGDFNCVNACGDECCEGGETCLGTECKEGSVAGCMDGSPVCGLHCCANGMNCVNNVCTTAPGTPTSCANNVPQCGGRCCSADQYCSNSAGQCVSNQICEGGGVKCGTVCCTSGQQCVGNICTNPGNNFFCENDEGSVKTCELGQICYLGECKDIGDTGCDEGKFACPRAAGSDEFKCCELGKTCGADGECQDQLESCDSGKTSCGALCCDSDKTCQGGTCVDGTTGTGRCAAGTFECQGTAGDFSCCTQGTQQCTGGTCVAGTTPLRLGTTPVNCALQTRENCWGQASDPEEAGEGELDPEKVCAVNQASRCVVALVQEGEGESELEGQFMTGSGAVTAAENECAGLPQSLCGPPNEEYEECAWSNGVCTETNYRLRSRHLNHAKSLTTPLAIGTITFALILGMGCGIVSSIYCFKKGQRTGFREHLNMDGI